MTFSSIRQSWYSRLISLCLMVTFIATMVITPRASYAQGVLGLPDPGTMVNLSPSYVPLMLTGLTVHPENPLLMDFIVSTGNSGMNATQVKKESDRLIKYFLACLTIPENNQWVNLSPYEKQRIIPEDLGQTVLGQDMLAQDYILKQLTASLIYPEKNLGRNFWDKVYAKARVMYGTTQIPVNTFNKVWILPEYAKVYEHNNTVLVVKSHLKVMLDEDYLSLQKHNINSPSFVKEGVRGSSKNINSLGSNIIRQIILPAIEEEVNHGQNFAQLRQIYNSMILAVWFKNNLKQALLNQVYSDKSKVNGVNVDDPAIKEKIYKQYLQAYKKGVFNYIKEEVDQKSQQTIPRKYFSGGIGTVAFAMISSVPAEMASAAMNSQPGNLFVLKGKAENALVNSSAAMVSAFHETLWRKIKEFASKFRGATPQSTHNVIRKVRVSDIVAAGGDIKNMPLAERIANMTVAEQKIEELSREGKKIAIGAMVAGMASRNQTGLLPKLYITAMQEDPEQFVDKNKIKELTAEQQARIAQIGLRAFINSLNPYDERGSVIANADHDVLNRLLHESKALLPVNKEAIRPEEYPEGFPEKYRSKTGWYNFLAYSAINVARANDELEKKGLKRIFVFKIMASELNYQNIMDNLIHNNFFGLNVPGVRRDATGRIIDIDHTDLRNEVVIYTQGLGYRLVAPVEVVNAQWETDQELLNQADQSTSEDKKKSLWAKTKFATDGNREKALANYRASLAFSEASEREGKNVLYDSPVAEGHGERWAMQFQINKFGPQVPNFLLDYQRKIQYDFFHNIDNMASLDDNWMVIFGWMLRNKKKVVMESSMKPGNESAGGGYTWTLVNGKLVMRQVEVGELTASITDRTISPEYNADEEVRKDREDRVGDVKDEMPVNNATLFAELPTTAESIRTGEDAISANMSQEMRDKLAAVVEHGDFEHVDLNEFKKFGDELRSQFGALTTPKVLKGKLILINETLAWDIQKGLLPRGQVGIVFTGSLADVRERGFNAEQARFIPLKQRPDAADPVINGARDKVSRRILFGNFFGLFLPLVKNPGSNAMLTEAKVKNALETSLTSFFPIITTSTTFDNQVIATVRISKEHYPNIDVRYSQWETLSRYVPMMMHTLESQLGCNITGIPVETTIKGEEGFVMTFTPKSESVGADASAAQVAFLPNAQVHMPVNDYRMGRGALQRGIIKTRFNAQQVLDMLRQAKQKGIVLRIVGYLRGIDGAGSSLDLPLFQKLLTPVKKLLKWFNQLPSTVTITSDQKTTITFELNDDPDAISYEAPDYLGEGKVYTVNGEVGLTEKGRLPEGQKQAPAYIFRNIFGLRGVKIKLEGISSMALAGGMGSSGAFNVSLVTAASILSGANLSYADIVALAVKLENDEFGGLTGGQETWATVLGGAHQLVWLSGIEGNHYGVAMREVLSPEQINKVGEHVFLTQPGKSYTDGKADTDRTAALVNFMWTDLLNDDPEGQALHAQKVPLAAEYAQALADGDFKTVVRVLNTYADIRDKLASRWLNLMLDAHQGKTDLSYAKEYARKVFAPQNAEERKDYKVVRDLYDELVVRLKRVDIFRAISLYSTEDIKVVIRQVEAGTYDPNNSFRARVRRAGGALFDAGAGAPGSNKIVVFSQGKQYAEKFFAREEIPLFAKEQAKKVIRGTGLLRMYMPFKVGKPIQVEGFDQLDAPDGQKLKLPQMPPKRTVVPHDVGFQSAQTQAIIARARRSHAMIGVVRSDATIQSVSPRNQNVTVKTKGTAGWRSYMMSQMTKGDLNGVDATSVMADYQSHGYIDFDGVVDPRNLPTSMDDFMVAGQFSGIKQQLFDILMGVAKEQGPMNEENLGRAASSSILQMQTMVENGTYRLKNPAKGLRVLVGYDGRPNANEYANYVARVAGAYEGVSVDLADDLIATPDGLQQTRRDEEYDLVLVLTASHNDWRYLGLKVGNDGGIADDNITGEIDRLANTPEGRKSFPIMPVGTVFNKVNLKARSMARYQAAFSSLPNSVREYLSAKPNSVFVNFMHGSDGRYRDFFRSMGVPDENIHMVSPMRDGNYPKKMVVENGKKVYWRPQPVREMLEDQLKAFEDDMNIPEGAVYLTIDGDADRFGVWEKLNGKMVQVGTNPSEEISPNEMSLMFIDYMIKKNLVPEGVKRIVITRPTGKAVAKRAQIAGYEVIYTPVGSKYLKKYMNDSDNPQATLVFEESGHGGFRIVRAGHVFNFFDDGLAQALFFLEIMTDIAKQGLTPVQYINRIKEEINYKLVYKKIAVNATDAAKDKIRNALQASPKPVEIMGRTITNVRELVSLIQGIVQGDKHYKVKQVLHTGANDNLVTMEQFLNEGVKLNPNEGLNIEFDTGAKDNVWIEIRMSGTEPIIRVYGQFENQQQADRVMETMDKEFFNAAMLNTIPDEELDVAASKKNNLIFSSTTIYYDASKHKVIPNHTETSTASKGGIDLNSRNLHMESEGQKVNITFDPVMIAQFKRGDFSGVRIQILDVVPINLMPLLGLKEDEAPGQVAKA